MTWFRFWFWFAFSTYYYYFIRLFSNTFHFNFFLFIYLFGETPKNDLNIYALHFIMCNLPFLFLFSTIIYKTFLSESLRYPLCKNCVYYKPSFFDSYNFGECKKFSKKDNKTDILVYQYTHRCRDDETECGKNGTFYERKITFFPF